MSQSLPEEESHGIVNVAFANRFRNVCGENYLGAMVIDARLGSVAAGASLFPPYDSQSSVFCRRPHVRRMRSDISLMSDDELPESNAELFLDLLVK